MNRGANDPGLWAENIFLGIGSNMGNRLDHLQKGIHELVAHNRISVVSVSSVFESEFVGEGTQDPYLNACIGLRTTLSPNNLLSLLKVIEQVRGRRLNSHMEPRPLDIDVLFFGFRQFQTDYLVVPHPRMTSRGFVMEPLAQLVPSKINPDSGETVAQVCAKIWVSNENRLMVRDDLCLIAGTPDHKEE